MATEWTVESRGGGTCTVRVVHSWFAESDDWDKQFEGTELGWVMFFRVLRAYLTHFPGQHATVFQVMQPVPGEAASVWRTFTEALGVGGATVGSTVTSAPNAPRFSAIVERVGPAEHPELLLRFQQPIPGLAHLFAMPIGGSVLLPLRVFLFGSGAPEAAAQMEPRWKAWVEQRFPAPAMR